MPELRTAREDELAEMLAFDREYAGSDISRPDFRRMFDEYPELFVVYEESGELVAEANGRMRRVEEDPTGSGGEAVVLQSMAVKCDRRGEGLGITTLEFFEKQATYHARSVSAASANDVEGFYRSCGYEPKMILLQVMEDDLPGTYRQADRFVGERSTESGVRFLYAGFEDYDSELRRTLADDFNAFEANTIFEKQLCE